MAKNVSSLKKEFEEQFGTSLNPRQLWALVKFAKHVRLRCRNNAAFNNFASQMFPYAQFRQVTKQRPSWKNPGTMETYPGLSITVNQETLTAEDTGESDE